VSAVSGPTTVASFGYTLDPAGKRTRIAEADGTNRVYGYDALDRLTRETVTGALSYAKTFTYGVTGNRLTQVTTGTGAASVAYTYDLADHLKTENATSYTYDANGNVTSKSGEATYAWDFENRLVSVTMSDGTVVSHVYDVDGNRVKTTVTLPAGAGPAVVTNMLVDASDGLSQVVAETDGAGALQAYYVRAGNELLAVMRPQAGGTWATRHVHQDALGSVRALTDEAGVLADTRGYEAFGTMNVEAGSDPLPYRFAGEPFDATSKLAYHRARWMDSRVGRFAGMDPWGGDAQRPATLHRYAYGTNLPTNLVDPSGMDPEGIGGIGGFADPGLDVSFSLGSVVRYLASFLFPLEITAVRDSVARAVGGVSSRYIQYSGVNDLVSRVLAKAGETDIDLLDVYDHAASNGMSFGNTFITNGSPIQDNQFSNYATAFGRLKGHFASPRGRVVLNTCGGASPQNQPLLMQLSDTIGVPVMAPGAGDTVCETENTFWYGIAISSTISGEWIACSKDSCFPVAGGSLHPPL
jgi:RHS repeat-associated protein